MPSNETLSLYPYTAFLILSLVILRYVWSRRQTRGARLYAWYMIGQCFLIAGFTLELISQTIESKLFWDSFQWVVSSVLPITIVIFAAEYTEKKIPNLNRLALWVSIIPLLFLLLAATNSLHNLVYKEVFLSTASQFNGLGYNISPLMITYIIYGFAFASIGMYLLLRQFFHLHNLYRAQIAIIILGFFILAVGIVLSLFNLNFMFELDSMPLMAAIANAIVAWGFFRYQIFDFAPVGREKVFEAIIDPVVILDMKNIVIDINRSMLDMLGRSADEAIGHPVKEIFETFPIPIKAYAQVSHARVETSFEVSGKCVYYELTVWPIYNNRGQMTGRTYISHDITALKELEGELRKLNLDLENRVQLRTQELAQAYDTTLEGWAKALEYRDKETEGHSRRVTAATLRLARALDIPEADLIHIRRGAILHDIGKMAIPDEILRKTGPLTIDERGIVQRHPETALKMLEGIPFLEKALEIPYCHHEKWDGSGYPNGLKERQIPLSARIFALADVWDALCSDRPYSQPWPKDKVVDYIIEQTGKHFDPEVARVFIELVERDEI